MVREGMTEKVRKGGGCIENPRRSVALEKDIMERRSERDRQHRQAEQEGQGRKK